MSIPLSRYFSLLSRYLRVRRGSFALLAALLLGGITLQVIVPQFTRSVIDNATAADAASIDPTGERLTIAAVAFIVLAILQQAMALSATYVGERVAWSATNDLRADLFDHVLRLDMGFHHAMTAGMLIERIDGDVSQMAEFFSQFFIRIVGSLLLAVGILFALYLEDARAGLVFTVFAVVALAVLYRVRGIAVEPSKKLREGFAQLSGFIEERLSGVEDLKANGAVGYVIASLIDVHRDLRRRWSRTVLFNSIFQSTSGMVLTLGFVTAFLSGYFLYESGALTIGGVYLIMNYLILLNRPLTDLSQQVERLQTISASIERIYELLNTPSAIRALPDGETRAVPPGALTAAFEGITFSYDSDQPVIHDLSLTVEAGSVLGVVGRTGSGKSTLARLLFRLYDPQTGQITFSGVPLPSAPLESLRERVAMVTQDVQLFEGTVRDNLTFFDGSVGDERILDALSGLELDGWLRELPDGLDTKIGAGGRGLSAGQAQLLAFGRAMLRQPDLVILDEASSRLDPATEARIERAVDRLLTGRTAILIAHRLATLDRADAIVMIERGKVIEHGKRAVLAADASSRFYHLLQMSDGLIDSAIEKLESG